MFRLLACAFTAAGVSLQAATIVNVVETGGDNEATDTVPAKWTGVTFVGGIVNEPVPGLPAGASYTVGPFGNHAPAYVDRNHRWTNASDTVFIPPYLIDHDYIMIGNDNRDNLGLRLDVTVNSPVRVYLLIDNRLGGAATTPPTFDATHMQWVLDEAWTPVITGTNRFASLSVPDEVGIDESADGTINNWMSVYAKDFPAGTFQLKQPDNAGQNMYGVVVAALPPSTPVVRLISPPTNTATFFAATNDLVIGIVSSTPMDTNNLQLVLNGSNVTGASIVSGDDTNVTVTYSGLVSNTIYTGMVEVTNNAGTTVYSFSFDTFVLDGLLVIEAEDYNYGDGDCSQPANPLPPTQGGFFYDSPAPGTYSGLMGYPGIDYSDASTNVNLATTNVYRLCDAVGTRVSSDVLHDPFEQGGFPNHDVWQMQAGDWVNYTRTIAGGSYAVYLRVATTAATSIRLDKVFGDVTLTTDQPTSPAGTFVIPNTDGVYRYVRLTDVLGSNAVVSFTSGGAETVRLSVLAANPNARVNYLLFVPAEGTSGPPTIASVSPIVNGVDIPTNAVISAAIVNGGTAVNPASIVLTVNGVDVTSSATVSNSLEGVTVFYSAPGGLQTNAIYTVSVRFSDDAAPAASFTNTWSFRTISGAPFITQAQQGTANHWSEAIWSNPPNTTVTSPIAGNKYVAVAGANPTRVRNPASGSGDPIIGVKTFPGDSLQLNAGSEIRSKGPGNALGFPGVNGEPGLILNGGNLDPGDDAVFPITGVILVQAPSTITSGDGVQIPRGWLIEAELRGSASLQVTKQVNSTIPAVEVTSTNNSFSGDWIVKSGLLKGTGSNSLGTGNIIIAATNSAMVLAQLEIMYDIDTPGVLTLTNGGQLILHQNARFSGMIVEGTELAPGAHSYEDLLAAYPNNFAPGGSGSVFITGPAQPGVTLTNVGLSGGNFSFSFATSNGVTYIVEYKDDLNQADWVTLQTITGDGGIVTITNALSEAPRRFFQVRTP